MRRVVAVGLLLGVLACKPAIVVPTPAATPDDRWARPIVNAEPTVRVVVVASLTVASASATPVVVPSAVGVPVRQAQFASVFTPTPLSDYRSRGMGLSRHEWENLNSPESIAGLAERFGGVIRRAEYVDDRVAAIREAMRDGLTVESTRDHIKVSMLPDDTSYVRTYWSSDGRVVDVFHSPSLPGRLPSATWREPGVFGAVYHLTALSTVDRIEMVLNPPE